MRVGGQGQQGHKRPQGWKGAERIGRIVGGENNGFWCVDLRAGVGAW